MRKKYINQDSYASLPGNIEISKEKLKEFHPEYFGISKFISKFKIGRPDMLELIAEHMYYGDSQPAVVISTNPLFIAAYSDDIDCVILLRFNQKYVERYNLEERSRLLSVNTYGTKPHKDIIPGPKCENLWNGCYPIISEFVSDDMEQIENRKTVFAEDQWDYVYKLGKDYLVKMPDVYRDGCPGYSCVSRI